MSVKRSQPCSEVSRIRVSPRRHWLTMAIQNISPGWFSCIMGTGILAICMTLSPVEIPLIEYAALGLWIVDVALFVFLLLIWGLHHARYPVLEGRRLHSFIYAQSLGTPPMACFTIASGFMLIGQEVLDPSLCALVAQILWVCGVLGSLFSAVIVPYFMFTHHNLNAEQTYGSWLLPVVPLIGAAVPSAMLVEYWPTSMHLEILVLNYVLWGTGVVLAVMMIVLFYSRLVYHKVPQGALVPTFWLVIGPLGQSTTAILVLGKQARNHLPSFADILQGGGVAYGLVAWGFGLYWLALAIMVTLRAARVHLPFNLSWWSFIYPVGVMTTGTYALYEHVPTYLFMGCGLVLLLLLTALWLLVSTWTVYHVSKCLKRS